MFFFRQTLLSVCLILLCVCAYAQPTAVDDPFGSIVEDSGPVSFNILINDQPGDYDIDPASVVFTGSATGGTFNYLGGGQVEFTPDADFFGAATIGYTVADVNAQVSEEATITVDVTEVNDAPVINGQVPDPLVVNEEESFTIDFNALDVVDVDNNYPTGFVLSILPGSNYTFSGNQVTPDDDFAGDLEVNLTVADGSGPEALSASYVFKVQVNGLNDPPAINGPGNQTTQEDVTINNISFTVSDIDTPLGDLDITATSSDQSVVANENITYGGNNGNRTISITPEPNASGVVTITLTVSDGSSPTATTFQLEIVAVNDAPEIDGQNTVTVNEGSSVTLSINDLVVTDVDNTPAQLTLVVLPGDDYAFSGTTITPNSNVNGSFTVKVQVRDDENALSNEFDLEIGINEINDAPTITLPSGPFSVNEDGATSFTIQVDDEETPAGDLVVSAATGDVSIVAVDGIQVTGSSVQRTVTITPVANAFGDVTITLTVADEGNATATVSFDLVVNALNDAPVINGQIPDPLEVEEEETFTIGFSNLDVTDVDNTYPTGFVLTISPGANYSVSGNQVTPTPDFVGNLEVNVAVADGTGPGALTDSYVFNVQVNGVNDPPNITNPGNQNTQEDVPIENIAFTVSDPDTPQEDLVVTATSNNQSLVADANILVAGSSGNRTVSIQPEPNASGTVNITLAVTDDGNSIASTTFQLVIQSVNDAPTITTAVESTVTIPEEGETTDLAFSIADVETPAASLAFDAIASNSTLLPSEGITLGGSGNARTLRLKPAANQFGTTLVTVSVTDGNNETTTFEFTLHVSPVNDLPTISTPDDQETDEDVAITGISVTITDFETAVNALTVTATSSNTTLIPNGNISVSTTGGTRTVSVTPASNQSGTAVITLTVDDGTGEVSTQFNVTVNAVNDAPVITGQNIVSTDEDEPVEILFSHLVVTDPDPDDVYPTGFTLEILSNPGYAVSGNTITPAQNVTGTLTVRVRVNDGMANSNIYPLEVTVNAINDPPVITGQVPLSVTEDNTITIQLNHLTIVDPDNNSGFTLTLADGVDYNVTGNVVTPNLNFNGTLSVPVTVSDGTNTSAPFSLQINVSPVNDAPVVTGQSTIDIDEVEPVALNLSLLTVFDPDNEYPDDFTLSILSGPNYTLTGNTITPIPNFSGTLLVQVFVNDGQANSALYSLQIQVKTTNDAPVITGQKLLSTGEDEPITIELSDLMVTDPDNPYPTGFTLTILPGSNYTASGTTVTPSPNFEGILSVGVKVNDGSVDSAPFFLQIAVVGVNNAPTITGQFPVTTIEDTPITLRLADLQVDDPDNPFPLGFTLTVSPGTNYTVSGNTVTPKANFAGTLSVPVVVNDGQLDSDPFSLQITVTPVNDPPEITGQKPLTTLEDQAITLSLSDFTVTDVDNTYPSGFTLIVQNGPSYQVSGATVTPNANFTGVLTVGVVVRDGAANSNVYNAEITVQNVNDAPTLSVIDDVTIQEDPEELVVVQLNGITAGPGEANQTIKVTASNDHPEWFETFTVAYTSGATGTLNIKPKKDIFGTTNIIIRVEDNGPAGPAPNVNVIERSFNLVIEPVNDAPVFVSEPQKLAEVGQPYSYLVQATDVEGEVISFSAPTLPEWLILTQDANGSATLTGTPPAGTTGGVPVVLQVQDPVGDPVSKQEFSIMVNSRATLGPILISMLEDNTHVFGTEFGENFTDSDGDELAEITFTLLPKKGTLKFKDAAVTTETKIPANEIADNLQYVPMPDSTGTEVIHWNGSDGIFYSLSDATLTILIDNLNDAPEIIALELPESDTLKYEIGSEIPIQLTKTFDARDADGDNLVAAEIAFADPLSYHVEKDKFIFNDTLGITGTFNESFGVLTLTGTAPVKDYVAAIRTVKYNYIDATDVSELNRLVTIKLSDGVFGQTKARLVGLIYTYVELDIANAFTPNGDQENAFWRIYSPNGLERYKDALIRVYNKRGNMVYETTGFSNPWNGDGPDGPLPPDVYYYTIDLKYDKKKFKGVVTILR